MNRRDLFKTKQIEPITLIPGLVMNANPGLSCGDEGGLALKGDRIPWSGARQKNGEVLTTREGELRHSGAIGRHANCPASGWMILSRYIGELNILRCDQCTAMPIVIPSSVKTYGELRRHMEKTGPLIYEAIKANPLFGLVFADPIP